MNELDEESGAEPEAPAAAETESTESVESPGDEVARKDQRPRAYGRFIV